jgi:hypothetical protein
LWNNKEGIRIGDMGFTVNEKAIWTPPVSRIQEKAAVVGPPLVGRNYGGPRKSESPQQLVSKLILS